MPPPASRNAFAFPVPMKISRSEVNIVVTFRYGRRIKINMKAAESGIICVKKNFKLIPGLQSGFESEI